MTNHLVENGYTVLYQTIPSKRKNPIKQMLSHLAYMMIKLLTKETPALTVWPFRGWRHNPPQPSGDWCYCRKCRHRFRPVGWPGPKRWTERCTRTVQENTAPAGDPSIHPSNN